MSAIATLLNTLSVRRAALSQVQAQIDQIAGELTARRKVLESECKGLESEIKSKAKYVSDPHTLRGDDLQLVWAERRSVDLDALDALFDRYDVPAAERALVVDVKGSWAIRARSKRESGQAAVGLIILLAVILVLCVVSMNGSLSQVGGFGGLFAKLTGFIPALP